MNYAEKIIKSIMLNVDLSDPHSMRIPGNRSLEAIKRRWDTLAVLARCRPDLIMDSDVDLVGLGDTTAMSTFNNVLMRRVIKVSIPTSEEVYITPEEAWVQISLPVYEVLSVLIWIHWCTSEDIKVFPPGVVNTLSATELSDAQNDAMVYALRQIAVLSAVNPQLWDMLIKVYQESLGDELAWVYKSVYLYTGKHRESNGIVSIAFPRSGQGSSIIDFGTIATGFQKLIDVASKLITQLGCTLGEYLQQIVAENTKESEEELDMDMSLNILDRLLRESVVVTKDGEVLNVTYDPVSGSVSVTKRDPQDPVNTVDDRPIITKCTILVGDKEENIVHLSTEEMNRIVSRVHQVVSAEAYVNPQVADSTVVIRAVPDPNAIVQPDGTVTPPQTAGTRAPGIFEDQPEDGWVPGDVRIIHGAYSIYTTVNLGGAAIGMWRAASQDDINRARRGTITDGTAEVIAEVNAVAGAERFNDDTDDDDLDAVNEVDELEEREEVAEVAGPTRLVHPDDDAVAWPVEDVAQLVEVVHTPTAPDPAEDVDFANIPAGTPFTVRPPDGINRVWMRLPNGSYVFL